MWGYLICDSHKSGFQFKTLQRWLASSGATKWLLLHESKVMRHLQLGKRSLRRNRQRHPILVWKSPIDYTGRCGVWYGFSWSNPRKPVPVNLWLKNFKCWRCRRCLTWMSFYAFYCSGRIFPKIVLKFFGIGVGYQRLIQTRVKMLHIWG